MRQDRRTVVKLAATLVATSAFPVLAQAPAFPAKAITIVVPYAAGGPTDITARRIAEAMAKRLGVPVVVENKPGAGTTVAAAFVAKAPKDGYTLLMALSTTTSVNPHLYRSLPYKSDDFAPISLVSKLALVLTATPELPARNLKEFVTWGAKQPEGVSFGSTGIGTQTHLVGEWIGRTLGVKMVHVPYKGSSQSTGDLVGGRLATQIDAVSSAAPLHNTKKARVLAVMGTERSPLLQDVPTFAEMGFPDLVAYTYFGLLAPAGTPPAIIDRLHATVVAAVASPEFTEPLIRGGELPVSSASPADYARQMEADYAHWGKVIRPLNIKLD